MFSMWEEPRAKWEAWRPNGNDMYVFRHGSPLYSVLLVRASHVHRWSTVPFNWDKLLYGMSEALRGDVKVVKDARRPGAANTVLYLPKLSKAARCALLVDDEDYDEEEIEYYLRIRFQLTKWREKGAMETEEARRFAPLRPPHFVIRSGSPLKSFMNRYAAYTVSAAAVSDGKVHVRDVIRVVEFVLARNGGHVLTNIELVYLSIGDLKDLFGGATMVARNEVLPRLLVQMCGTDGKSVALIRRRLCYTARVSRICIREQFAYKYRIMPKSKLGKFLASFGLLDEYKCHGIDACHIAEALLKYIEVCQRHDPANPRVVLPDKALLKLLFSRDAVWFPVPLSIGQLMDQIKETVENGEESDDDMVFDDLDCPYDFDYDYRWSAI